ncbi:MAG: hydrogenase maturation nickel metallochaperone HypA [Acetatifactor sp.]|nr:hydrogenase maturation nickel metallochaperone HypA [Acetatifactor sp.]
MHELGVVFKVIDNLKEVAEENSIDKISRVTIGLGEVSTVIPEYLQDCFKWAKRKSPLVEECELEIETIPAVTYCEDCGETYPTVSFAKICPRCHSENTYLIQGNEFVIKEIEVP